QLAPQRLELVACDRVADLLAVDLADRLDRLLRDLQPATDGDGAGFRHPVEHRLMRLVVFGHAGFVRIEAAINEDAVDVVAVLALEAGEYAADREIHDLRIETDDLALLRQHEG